MKNKLFPWRTSAMLVSLFFISNGWADDAPSDVTVKYEVKAGNAKVNRKVTGPVVAAIDGVAAEPVDSFVWDGDGSVPVMGSAKLEVDPVANTGKIHAQWQDMHGEWTYHQTVFAPPHHATGLRIGASSSATELIYDDPITTNVYLHGDTMAGGPVLPTVATLLATWGPASVTLNGRAFNNPYDGPVPFWVGHTMVTEGVRGSDGTVRTTDGDIFSFAAQSMGTVDHDDVEFHIVFHEAPGPMVPDNLPPNHSFFYHLTFEDVKVEIKHKE